jgi:hypothetical protein
VRTREHTRSCLGKKAGYGRHIRTQWPDIRVRLASGYNDVIGVAKKSPFQ